MNTTEGTSATAVGGSALSEGLGPLLDSEEDPARLWAEIHRLRAAVRGPQGYASWQDAATDERMRRVTAERRAQERLEPMRAELHAMNERYMTLLKAVADGQAMLPRTYLVVIPEGPNVELSR